MRDIYNKLKYYLFFWRSLKQLESEIDDKNRIIQNLNELLKESEESKHHIQIQLEEKEEEIDKFRKLLSEKTQIVEKLERNNSRLNEKLQEKNEEIDRLKRRLSEKKETIKELEESVSRLNEKTQELRIALSTKEKITGELQKKILWLEVEKENKDKEIRDLKESTFKLRELLSEREKYIESLKEKISSMKTEIQKKEEEINGLKVSLSEKEKFIKELQKKILWLETENENKDKEIVELKQLLYIKQEYIEKLEGEIKALKSDIKAIKNVISIFDNEEFRNDDNSELLNVLELHINELVSFINKKGIFKQKCQIIKDIENKFTEYRTSIKRKLKGKLIICFAGRYSSGKSSIINALLEDNILPSSDLQIRLPQTYIYYSNEKTYRAEDKNKNIIELNHEILLKLASLKEGFSILPNLVLEKIFIGHNNSLLEDIIILDTPGFDSQSIIHKKISAEAIEAADYVFWVIDANDGIISNDSIKFINSYIQNKPLYFLINKVDTKSPVETEKIEKKIRDVISEKLATTGSIEIYRTSVAYERSINVVKNKIMEIKSKHNLSQTDFFSFIESLIRDIIRTLNLTIKNKHYSDTLRKEFETYRKDIFNIRDNIRQIKYKL